MERKKTQNSYHNTWEEHVGGLVPPNFKSCYKVTMNKTAWFIKVIEAGMNETK